MKKPPKFDELSALSRGIGPHAVLLPLSEREIEQRLTAMRTRYRSPDLAADAVEEAFPGLLDFVFDVTQTTLEDVEAMFLELVVVRASHVLKPPAGPAPALDFERILRDFAGEFACVSKIMLGASKTSAAFERWITDGPQPAVMQDLTTVLLTFVEQAPRKERPRDEAILIILACTKALVAELARAPA
ncbi:hypothetical protein BH20VER1_BH20VER1_04070 [soil metagenome]